MTNLRHAVELLHTASETDRLSPDAVGEAMRRALDALVAGAQTGRAA